MNHNGAMLLAVFADVGHIEAFGHEHIELNGAALPGTADGIFYMEIEFRTVKSAVSFIDLIGHALFFNSFLQGLRRQLPNFVAAHGIFGPCRKFDVIF